MNIAVVIGTRPEIIKMSPIIRELQRKNIPFYILHTGQHYSYNLDKIFFRQLKLPEPKYNLEVGSGSHGEQTAKILTGVEKILQHDNTDILLVEGDTNSVLAGALAAAKLHVKVGHIEAGLRSYDRNMPEEINRILVDHCSDYLFTPTEKAQNILLKEGISPEKIFVTGNTIVDAVMQNRDLAHRQNDILKKLNIEPKKYLFVTLHRTENVDNKERLTSVLSGLSMVSEVLQLSLICPVHPHTYKRIEELNIAPAKLTLIEPVDYLSCIHLEDNARLILTDSGGIQEEACILGTPCVTLRDNTERPETLEVGANMLAGVLPQKMLECSKIMVKKDNGWQNPFGNGTASEQIINILQSAV